jgi:hypothetical protein
MHQVRSEDVTPAIVIGWFCQAIKRRSKPTEHQCVELAAFIKKCSQPMGCMPREVRQSLEKRRLDADEVRGAINRILKAIDAEIAELDQELVRESPAALMYPFKISVNKDKLEKLAEDLRYNSVMLCGGLHRRKHRDAAWHGRANVIADKVRAALVAAGWRQIALNPSSPLVDVTRRALEITEQREFSSSEVASALGRMPAERGRRKTLSK